MTKKYGFWQAVGDITGAALAVPTFGASMVLSPTARGLVGGILGGGGGDDNNAQQLLEQQKLQNEQYKLKSKERKEELERLRKEREKDEQKIKQNNEEIDRLRLIINDPHKSDEEKNRARNRMIVLEDENRKLKGKIGEIEKQIKNTEDDKPTAPNLSTPFKLPKLSAYDKLLVVAALLLIIYFLFLRDNRKS